MVFTLLIMTQSILGLCFEYELSAGQLRRRKEVGNPFTTQSQSGCYFITENRKCHLASVKLKQGNTPSLIKYPGGVKYLILMW